MTQGATTTAAAATIAMHPARLRDLPALALDVGTVYATSGPRLRHARTWALLGWAGWAISLLTLLPNLYLTRTRDGFACYHLTRRNPESPAAVLAALSVTLPPLALFLAAVPLHPALTLTLSAALTVSLTANAVVTYRPYPGKVTRRGHRAPTADWYASTAASHGRNGWAGLDAMRHHAQAHLAPGQTIAVHPRSRQVAAMYARLGFTHHPHGWMTYTTPTR